MCGRQHYARWTFWFSTVRCPGRDCRRRSENHTERVKFKGVRKNSTPSQFSKNPQASSFERSRNKTSKTDVSVTDETVSSSRVQ